MYCVNSAKLDTHFPEFLSLYGLGSSCPNNECAQDLESRSDAEATILWRSLWLGIVIDTRVLVSSLSLIPSALQPILPIDQQQSWIHRQTLGDRPLMQKLHRDIGPHLIGSPWLFRFVGCTFTSTVAPTTVQGLITVIKPLPSNS